MSNRSLALVAVFASLMAAQPVQNARAAGFLPLTRTQIVGLIAGAEPRGAVEVKTVDAKKTRPAEAFAPGDELSVVRNSKFELGIFLAGKGENIHSIRILVPVVGYSREQADQVFKMLSSLFVKIYPSWPDAAKWPKDSLSKSWSISPLMTGKTPANTDDLIIRHETGGVTSATFGVPPDIVVYSITTHAECIPTTKTGNPFQRAVC
jgi:hypothetical protein